MKNIDRISGRDTETVKFIERVSGRNAEKMLDPTFLYNFDIDIALIQEELQQKKQITDGTEILLTADNLQQYVKKIEEDRRKSTYTEFVF